MFRYPFVNVVSTDDAEIISLCERSGRTRRLFDTTVPAGCATRLFRILLYPGRLIGIRGGPVPSIRPLDKSTTAEIDVIRTHIGSLADDDNIIELLARGIASGCSEKELRCLLMALCAKKTVPDTWVHILDTNFTLNPLAAWRSLVAKQDFDGNDEIHGEHIVHNVLNMSKLSKWLLEIGTNPHKDILTIMKQHPVVASTVRVVSKTLPGSSRTSNGAGYIIDL